MSCMYYLIGGYACLKTFDYIFPNIIALRQYIATRSALNFGIGLAGRFVLIEARRCIFLLTDNLEEAGRLGLADLPAISLGTPEQSNDDCLIVHWSDGTSSSFTHPNMLCLGMLVLARPDKKAMTCLEWWRERGGVDLEIETVATDLPTSTRRASAMDWVLQRLSATLGVIGVSNQELTQQNMHLRRSYGALQNAFNRLERFVVGNHFHLPILQYETPKVSSFWQPSSEENLELVQLLPILSSKFSILELYLKQTYRARSGLLTITLRLQPSGRVLHVWEFGYATIIDGWHRFTPPPLIDDLSEIVVEVTWSTQHHAPSIGLSQPHWNTPYGAVDVGEHKQRRSLAMRLWSGLAGVRPPKLTAVAPPANSGQRGQLITFAQDVLSRASEHLHSLRPNSDQTSVQYDPRYARLIVHPRNGGLTIAVLPDPVPPGTTYASAVATTLNDKSSPVEYAMAIVPPGQAPEEIFTNSDPSTEEGSGWRTLPALKAARLAVDLERNAPPGARLCLATRLPPGSSEEHAWASWSGFELGIDWHTKLEPIQSDLDLAPAEAALDADIVINGRTAVAAPPPPHVKARRGKRIAIGPRP